MARRRIAGVKAIGMQKRQNGAHLGHSCEKRNKKVAEEKHDPPGASQKQTMVRRINWLGADGKASKMAAKMTALTQIAKSKRRARIN